MKKKKFWIWKHFNFHFNVWKKKNLASYKNKYIRNARQIVSIFSSESKPWNKMSQLICHI